MLLNEIEKLKKVITELLMEEFEAQGHKMTGKLIDDIEFDAAISETLINITGKLYPYGNILNRGVKSENIPFSGTGKKGGTSLYIQALKKYAQTRMNISDDKKALGVAFAIAHTQKKEGMPSKGSKEYSSTGSRTEWIEQAPT